MKAVRTILLTFSVLLLLSAFLWSADQEDTTYKEFTFPMPKLIEQPTDVDPRAGRREQPDRCQYAEPPADAIRHHERGYALTVGDSAKVTICHVGGKHHMFAPPVADRRFQLFLDQEERAHGLCGGA